MKRKKYALHTLHTEFELDLAPLLAVMVKLVPVLITSSVFVQAMIIESELPQGVQAAMEQKQDENKIPVISLNVSKKDGFTIETSLNNQVIDQKKIPLDSENKLNLSDLNKLLQEVKTKYPDVFQLHLRPDGTVVYDEIVKIIDAARKSNDSKVQFPLKSQDTSKVETTPFMFPDVVFANILEG
jgi:biopolymer transport protein ExbD